MCGSYRTIQGQGVTYPLCLIIVLFAVLPDNYGVQDVRLLGYFNKK